MNASIARRTLVAACLVGAVLGSTAGRAEDPPAAPPVLVSTSVDNGFSSLNPIAARFDRTINLTLSVGTLRDKNDTVVDSTLARTTSGAIDGDTLVLTPKYTDLRETLSPYTVSFTAVAHTAGPPGAGLGVTKQFTYDLERPEVAITAPAASGPVQTFSPGDALAGYAFDRYSYDVINGEPVARLANRSGLSRVEVQFYKLNPAVRPGSVNPGQPVIVSTDPPGATPGTMPTVTLPTVQPSQEVAALRHNAALSDCTRATCVQGEKTWTATTTGLTPGSWTARAYSVDVAGNRSMHAEVSFLVL